jgi:hypothetical protein
VQTWVRILAQFVGRLTALKVARVITPGMYKDGADLYLQVSERKARVARSWIYRFVLHDRERQMGPMSACELLTMLRAENGASVQVNTSSRARLSQ